MPVAPSQAALLFVDLQNYNCSGAGALYANLSEDEGALYRYFFNRIEEIKPNLRRLQHTCRDSHIEIMYTVIQSLTKDGRDRSMDYKITGFHVPPGCWDAQVIDCIKPIEDEIVIPKTSSSVFQSTNLDYILRCMGKKFLVLCGCLTDQCVDHAVRDACDLGYHVTLIIDCCATLSEERQSNALDANKGYCRQMSTDDFIRELAK